MKKSESNSLTAAIKRFLEYHGHHTERISVTGRWIPSKAKSTNMFTGADYVSGKGKLIKSSMQVGTADLSSTVFGKSVKIEVKINDKQSAAQKRYQQQIEASGGTYLVIRNITELSAWYEQFKKQHDAKAIPSTPAAY